MRRDVEFPSEGVTCRAWLGTAGWFAEHLRRGR
jgi:hypothetical protein